MTASRGFLGAGDLYIDRIVNGVRQGIVGPYECSKYEIKPNIDLKEMTSRGKDTYGQVIESVALAKPSDFTVELPEVNKESLALALLGTSTAINQAAGSAPAEVLAAVKLGVWAPLTYAKVSNVVVKNAAGTTTYVAGQDYLVNADMGWVKPLPGGAIVDGDQPKVTYDYAEITGTAIAGATAADVRARFILDGKNQADGLPCIVTVHEGVIAANAAFDFLKNDFNTVSLPGRMKTPVGYTEPFTVHMRDA